MTYDPKRELEEVVEIAVRGFLSSTRGAHIFGAKAEVWGRAQHQSPLLVKTTDGTVHLVKVWNSRWKIDR